MSFPGERYIDIENRKPKRTQGERMSIKEHFIYRLDKRDAQKLRDGLRKLAPAAKLTAAERDQVDDLLIALALDLHD